MAGELWRAGNTPGRLRIFGSGEELYIAVIEYLEWAVENPIEQEVLGWHQGEATREIVYKPRPFTLSGLAAHAGFGREIWFYWRKEREDLRPIIEWTDSVFFEQKFSGAAVGTFNPGLMSRDLGLADVQDHRSSDGSMSPKPNVIKFLSPELPSVTPDEPEGD